LVQLANVILRQLLEYGNTVGVNRVVQFFLQWEDRIMKLRFLITCIAIAIVATLGAQMVVAQANFFVPPGGVGSWNAASNWTLGHLPAAGETAIIHAGRDATLDIANPSPIAFLRIADNDVAAVDGTLNILSGADLHVTAQVLLAAGGASDNKGIINQSDGTLTVDDALFIAFDAPHTGVYNISGGVLTTGNLWFRFGNGTLTQTGGTVNAMQLVLAEGGNPFTSSLYDLQSGLFNVAGAANIGKAPGLGDPFAGGSLGSMNISGGIATFGELLFGTDPTDQIHISGSGILRVSQATLSEAAALAAITGGQITGTGLMVSTYDSGSALFTQVSVPEPTTFAAAFVGLCVTALIRKRQGT
jgi:hypothetical protein